MHSEHTDCTALCRRTWHRPPIHGATVVCRCWRAAAAAAACSRCNVTAASCCYAPVEWRDSSGGGQLSVEQQCRTLRLYDRLTVSDVPPTSTLQQRERVVFCTLSSPLQRDSGHWWAVPLAQLTVRAARAIIVSAINSAHRSVSHSSTCSPLNFRPSRLSLAFTCYARATSCRSPRASTARCHPSSRSNPISSPPL